ncbi:hypothetical protein ASG56_00975 [Rhodococcus sp. Leaf7]|uniref:glycosyltransferase n=1 Tax=unclassified Rhodococcus (in: high G+C Gram-positive bacteria) TaxID=192944 RepID=UPI0006F833B1|nr:MULTISPECIES: nucleotide disphospho-sugar-binding domain-containing protein [unclassified Rhodococcus (in: high G+C Gram-positive bacteria)]KQU06309.1 hypothetical protein ASG56_00975 [Rhodococcus sp. Leaf7]KQU41826.1 hypothetical protein ASG64_00975 [Rhodococcus sp. Leaf247]
MKLTLAFHGSRGDVQPGIALGVELEKRGHDVVLAVPPNMVEFASRSGLDARPCGVDTAQLLASPVVQRDMNSRNPIRRLAAITEMTVGGGRLARRQLLTYTEDSAAIIGGSVGQESALDVADLRGVPYVPVHFCPVRRNGSVSILPLPRWSPPWMHRAGWTALDRILRLASRRADNRLRRELGLAPMSTSIAVGLARSGVTEIQAYDVELFPGLDSEWGSRRPLTGFLGPDEATRRAMDNGREPLPEDLRAWLRSGPAPVYVGFGSMSVPGGPATVDTIVSAVRRAGRRVVIAGGWADIGSRESADVVTIGSVDHTALFPLCEAVVHHGGAGSTAAGLRAGRPTLVCHVGADQPMWGRRVVAAGVGAAVPASGITDTRLDAALTVVLDPRIRDTATTLATRLVPAADAVDRCADLVDHATAHTPRLRVT